MHSLISVKYGVNSNGVVVMKVQMSILNCNRSLLVGVLDKGPTKQEERMNLLYEFLCDSPLSGSFPPGIHSTAHSKWMLLFGGKP